MDTNQACEYRKLCLAIEKQLTSGIAISPDTMHFMASTFAIETPQALKVFLANQDDSETQSLLELLFSPDESIQVKLEAEVEKQICTEQAVQTITARLFRNKIEVPLRFPEDRTGIKIAIRPPEHLLETYVQNLKITRALQPDLKDAVDKFAPGDIQAAIKVKLRNTRFELTRPIRSFLCRWLDKTDCSEKSCLPDLAMCLAIISEQPESPSLFDLFMGKKYSLLTALQQAESFEKQLARNNIETLILKGVRAPHIDKAETQAQIIRIDTICLAVFGVTAPQLQVPSDVDLGNFRSPADLRKAFEILS